MRRIINGVTYDTKVDNHIADEDNGLLEDDPNYKIISRLYCTNDMDHFFNEGDFYERKYNPSRIIPLERNKGRYIPVPIKSEYAA